MDLNTSLWFGIVTLFHMFILVVVVKNVWFNGNRLARYIRFNFAIIYFIFSSYTAAVMFVALTYDNKIVNYTFLSSFIVFSIQMISLSVKMEAKELSVRKEWKLLYRDFFNNDEKESYSWFTIFENSSWIWTGASVIWSLIASIMYGDKLEIFISVFGHLIAFVLCIIVYLKNIKKYLKKNIEYNKIKKILISNKESFSDSKIDEALLKSGLELYKSLFCDRMFYKTESAKKSNQIIISIWKHEIENAKK